MDLAQAHSLDAGEIFQNLEVDPEKGLSLLRAETLAKLHGPNEINPEEPAPWWKKLAGQFMTPMVYLLAGATLISLAGKVTPRDWRNHPDQRRHRFRYRIPGGKHFGTARNDITDRCRSQEG